MKNTSYNNLKELLTLKYGFYEEEVDEILEKHPELENNWKVNYQNIDENVHVALYFGVSIEDITKNPKFLTAKPSYNFDKCKLKYLYSEDVDIDYLNTFYKIQNCTAIMNAILQGALPYGYNMFNSLLSAAARSGYNHGEFFRIFKTNNSSAFINAQLEKYHSQFYEDLIKEFPYFYVNRRVTYVKVSDDREENSSIGAIKDKFSVPATFVKKENKCKEIPDFSEYETFRELMINKYGVYEEDLTGIIEKIPNIETDWQTLRIETKLDILLHFGVKIEDIIDRPEFLSTNKTNAIFNKCKLAELTDRKLTINFLSVPTFFDCIIETMNAISLGDLPADYNVYERIENTCKYLNITREEFSSKYWVNNTKFINEQYERRFPERINELKKKFPVFYSKSTYPKAIQRQQYIEPRKANNELKEKIKAIWAEPRKPAKRKISLQSANYDEVCYSTQDYNEKASFNTPKIIENRYRNSNDGDLTIKGLNESAEVNSESVAEVDVEIENQKDFEVEKSRDLVVDKPQEIVLKNSNEKTELSLEDITLSEDDLSELAEDFALTYNKSKAEIQKRQKFLEENFNISASEFYDLIEERENLIYCSDASFLTAKNHIVDIFGRDEFILNSFVRNSYAFPKIDFAKIKEKVSVLKDFGVTEKQLVNLNHNIFKFSKERIATKLKLAFINELPVDIFLSVGYQNMEDSVWAKMQALKNGMVDNVRVYSSYEEFYSKTGTDPKSLYSIFPFNDEARKQLDLYYEQAKQSGLIWRETFKSKSKKANETMNGNLQSFRIDNITQEKFELLKKFGITKEDIENYNAFDVLGTNIVSLETKLKLALISGLSKSKFLNGCFRTGEARTYSRIKAQKNGELPQYLDVYSSNASFVSRTNVDSNELMKKYPYSEASKKEIDEYFNALPENKKCYNENGNASLESAYMSEKDDKKDAPILKEKQNLDFSEQDKELFSQVKKIGEVNEVKHRKPIETLTAEELNYIMQLFDASPKELEKLLLKYPAITNIKKENIDRMKEYLFDKLNVTSDEFETALRVSPNLSLRKEDVIDVFCDFAKNFMQLNKKQTKTLLLGNPSILTKIVNDPEDVIKRCNVISEVFDISFSKAVDAIIQSPKVLGYSTKNLASRIQPILDLNIPKELVLSNLGVVGADIKAIKLRYMLNKVCGFSDEDFVIRNYMTNESKIYARMMYNLVNNLDIDVHDSQTRYKSKLVAEYSHLERLPSFLEEDDVTLELMKVYPFGKLQREQIEMLYNNKCRNNPLRLTEEEVSYGL